MPFSSEQIEANQLAVADHTQAALESSLDVNRGMHNALSNAFNQITEFDPTNPAHIELRNRMLGIGHAVSLQEMQAPPDEADDKPEPPPAYAIRNDGTISVISGAGQMEMAQTGNVSDRHILTTYGSNPPKPEAAPRRAIARPATPPQRRRVIIT